MRFRMKLQNDDQFVYDKALDMQEVEAERAAEAASTGKITEFCFLKTHPDTEFVARTSANIYRIADDVAARGR